MVNRTCLCGLAVAVLSACGGAGGGGGSGIDPRLTRLDLYEAQRTRVLGDPGAGVAGLPLTPQGAVPDSGQVRFTGAALIQVERPDDILALAGDALLNLTFDTQTASGSVTEVFGEDSGGAIVDYAGDLALSGVADGAAFDLGYAGTLTAGADSLVFDGLLDATLLGDPIAGFAALDLEATVIQQGAERRGAVVLFGEGTVTTPPPPSP